MAEWKKVVVSGSAVSQLNNDSGYLISGQSSEVTLSGSFSGSFQGDGSNLTGITADVLGNTLNDGNGIADFSFDGSGAATVAVEADGSTLSVGAAGVKVADAGITATQLNTSIAGDGLSGGAGTALSVNVDGTSITTSGDNLTLAGTTFSSSVDDRIGAAQSLASTNSASLAALDATYATDAEVNTISSSLASDIATKAADDDVVKLTGNQTVGGIKTFSSSTNFSSGISVTGTIVADGGLDVGNGELVASSGGDNDNLFFASSPTSDEWIMGAGTTASVANADFRFNVDTEVFTAGDVAINGFSSVSSSLSDLEAFSSSLDSSFATEAELNAVSASVKTFATNADTTLSSSFANTIGNLDSIYATDASVSLVAATASAENQALSSSILVTTNALDGRVGNLETDSHTHSNKANLDAINQDLGTSDDVTFNDVVVSGDLTVSGTTTTLNTTNLLVEDKFILLNSGSANPDEGGLIIDEGAGSGHAFIYDQGDTRWGFNASVASDASTANATAHVAAVVDMQNVAHSDSAEYQKNGNIKVDNGDIFIYC